MSKIPYDLKYHSHKKNLTLSTIEYFDGNDIHSHENDFIYNNETDLLNLFDTYFDLTEETFTKLFTNLDKNKDGKISYEEFCQSLEALEIEITDDDIWSFIPKDSFENGKELSFNEFSKIIQGIKMGNLFKPNVIRDALVYNLI